MSFKYIFRQIDANAERWLLIPIYMMIVITVFFEVVRRFALSYSSVWGEEIARFMFIYISWIGASACIKSRAHIRIDAIIHFVPDKIKAVLYVFGDIVTFLFVCYMIYFSFHEVISTSWNFGSVTMGLRISRVWFLSAIPLGLTLCLVRLVQSLKRDISDLYAGRPLYRGQKIV
jgi:TRAP-type C4-dicarboxylate transport system permease small subunit